MASFGETLAVDFLTRRNVAIRGTNVRVGRSEIDIVGVVRGALVAFEVKTVVSRHPADDPIHKATSQKLALVRRGLRGLGAKGARVDVVTVLLDADGAAIRWIRDARW